MTCLDETRSSKLELANFVDRKMCNRTTEWE